MYLSIDGTEGKRLAWSVILSAAAQNKTVRMMSTGECRYHNIINEVGAIY